MILLVMAKHSARNKIYVNKYPPGLCYACPVKYVNIPNIFNNQQSLIFSNL